MKAMKFLSPYRFPPPRLQSLNITPNACGEGRPASESFKFSTVNSMKKHKITSTKESNLEISKSEKNNVQKTHVRKA